MILLNLAVSMFVFEGFLCRHFFRSYIYIITLALIYHAGMIDNYKLIIIILSYY